MGFVRLTLDAEKVVAELSKYGNCHIGWVGLGFLPAAFYKYVTEHLTEAQFEDATDMIDHLKAIKSDHEGAELVSAENNGDSCARERLDVMLAEADVFYRFGQVITL